MKLPRLYAIVDSATLMRAGVGLDEFASGLAAGGVRLLQYRDKAGGAQEQLENARGIGRAFRGVDCQFVMNDRSDLAVLAGWDGVHVGQGDLSASDARRVMGEGRIVGVSTHTEAQVRGAHASVADYVAIGPVFATGTKADAEPVIGLEGVRRARALTDKPLVAIGGITRANARMVVESGADSVAVISGLLAAGESVEKVARDFLEVLG